MVLVLDGVRLGTVVSVGSKGKLVMVGVAEGFCAKPTSTLIKTRAATARITNNAITKGE
jgi:hypothetical protein